MYPCQCENTHQQDDLLYRQQTKKQLQKPQGQQWTKTLDMLCWDPQNVKTKLDLDQRTLTLTTRVDWEQKRSRQTQRQPKSKQVIPLPKNINMMELAVQMYPKTRQILLTAPLTHTTKDKLTKQQQQHKVQHKMQQCSCFKQSQFPEEFEALYTPRYIRDIQPQFKQQKKHRSTPFDVTSPTLQAWTWPWESNTEVATLDDKMLTPKVKKDEKTGKWNLIIDVNTVVGFKEEEVKVTFRERGEESIVVIEAKRDLSNIKSQETKADVYVKVLREEIVVPREVLDGKKLRHYITKDGVLRIQLPCLRNPDTEKDTQKNSEQQ